MRKIILLVFVSLLIPTSLLASEDKRKKRFIKTAPPSPKITLKMRRDEHTMRRKRVAEMMDNNSMLILFSAPKRIYSNSVDFFYRQENNHYYLTGLKKYGSTFVMLKTDDSVSEAIFLPKRNPAYETWNGKMYSNEEAQNISGVSNIIDSRKLDAFLSAVKENKEYSDGFAKGSISKLYVLTGQDEREYGKENKFAAEVKTVPVDPAMPIFAKLRVVKSPYEQVLLQHAVDITAEALGRSMGMIGRAKFEYEVQAEVEYTFRRRNADYWGYPSIVGCGPNATTLHYIESQGAVKKGDLMLMDVGAEYDHYTADVTRTFPVNGKFTKEQAEIYQIVFDAQEAAAKTLKPGANFRDPFTAARAKVAEGLMKLGLITRPEESRVWYMHGWGHWLGMNVHDVGGRNIELKPGMIMTNEPGIYIREDALDNLPNDERWTEFKRKVRPAFEKYKNIGVRIEDDMMITDDGVRWMTKDLPRTIKDVEAFMAGAKKEMDRYALNRIDFQYRNTEPFDLLKSDAVAVAPGKTVRFGMSKHGLHTHSH